jgi:endonuclease YncB( thermonuclease family)
MFLSGFFLFLIISLVEAEELSGKVLKVLDGDGIVVSHKGKPEVIRLNALDCPEIGQRFGSIAFNKTTELAKDKFVRVVTYGKDRYGRTIGDVFMQDGRSLNQELLRSGLCHTSHNYSPETKKEK